MLEKGFRLSGKTKLTLIGTFVALSANVLCCANGNRFLIAGEETAALAPIPCLAVVIGIFGLAGGVLLIRNRNKQNSSKTP